ncbi:hypothetical protein U1Q18_050232, partial [Sarracenia purpurea var. burkii]
EVEEKERTERRNGGCCCRCWGVRVVVVNEKERGELKLLQMQLVKMVTVRHWRAPCVTWYLPSTHS